MRALPKNFVILSFIGAVLISGVAIYELFAIVTSRSCPPFVDPVRFEVGGIEFAVPAEYMPFLQDGAGFLWQAGEEASKPKSKNYYWKKGKSGYCEPSGWDSLKAPGGFWAFAQKNNVLPLGTERQPNQPFEINELHFQVLYTGNYPHGLYCETLQLAQSNSRQWKEYALNPMFRTYKSPATGWKYYYSDIVTLFGQPVVIYCTDGQVIDKRTGLPGYPCRMLAPLGKYLNTQIGLFNAGTPAYWDEMIQAYEIFLRTIIVQPIPSGDITYCE